MTKQTVKEVIGKFNVFDIFSMLIPGCITMCVLYVSLYPLKINAFENMGVMLYVVAIVLSYALGLVLHEVGRIFDEKILYKRKYNGDIRNNYSSENKAKIFGDCFLESHFDEIKKYLSKTTKLSLNDLNDRTIYHLCSNALEMSGSKNTADKFIVISEMSRSLTISFFVVGIIDLVLIVFHREYTLFFAITALVCFIFGMIFYCRKNRYEIFRLRNLLRIFYIKYCTEIEL